MGAGTPNSRTCATDVFVAPSVLFSNTTCSSVSSSHQSLESRHQVGSPGSELTAMEVQDENFELSGTMRPASMSALV